MQRASEPVYEKLAPRYDQALAPFERWFLARWRADVFRELPSDSRILEVGAGTGLNFRYYSTDGRGVATDLSREMIKCARHKAERPAGVALVQCRAEQLPFADAVFDAAFATLVFCSVE